MLTIKQDMKTATQLFPSSYLQPNNIDWIDGILEEKTREKFTILCRVLFLLFPALAKKFFGIFLEFGRIGDPNEKFVFFSKKYFPKYSV